MDEVNMIREALKAYGLDYVITRVEGNIAHVNIYIGD
tara:strand:+ start:7 stop:117 length:111 start_codon:yes stop_codon:yes gene_type:complete